MNAVEVEGLVRRFGAVKALESASISLEGDLRKEAQRILDARKPERAR